MQILKCKVNVRDAEGTITSQNYRPRSRKIMVFNSVCADEVGMVNELFDKK